MHSAVTITRWDRTASGMSSLTRREFGELLLTAPERDRAPLLRLRFRHHADEFAEYVLRPIISRVAQWSPLTDFHRAMLTVPAPYEVRGSSVSMDLTLAPRGVSKTTSKKISALHSILYGLEQGVAVIGASHRDAVAWVSTLVTWAREPELRRVYGDIPVTGTQTDLTIAGVPVWARGWSSSIRGLNRNGVRPTLILLDDIESEQNTRSEAARDTTQAALAGAVVPLGPTQGGHRIEWLATPVHHDAVAARVLRGEPTLSSWMAHRYPAVTSWPTDPVWEQVEATYLDLSSGLTPDERWARAIAQITPAAYDGAVTIDPVRLPIDVCFRRRIDAGPTAWAREWAVQPTAPGSTLFEPDRWPRYRVDGASYVIGTTTLPWRTLRLAMAYDPSEGGDDGAVALLGRETTGRCYVLDTRILTTRASLQVPDVVSMARQWGLTEILVEANQMPSLLRQAIEREAREQGVRLSIIEIRQTRNKEIRLSALEAPAANGLLAVRTDIPTHHLRLIEAFDPSRRDNRDDLLDAIEMAYTHLTAVGARWGRRPLG